jgi:hypothetical protein
MPLVQELKDIAETKLLFSAQHGIQHTQVDKPYTIFIDDKRLLGSPEWGMVKEMDVIQALKVVNKNYQFHLLDGHVPNDIIAATDKEIING